MSLQSILYKFEGDIIKIYIHDGGVVRFVLCNIIVMSLSIGHGFYDALIIKVLVILVI